MTKIKICGIKTINDALAAVDAGADLIGFNFYPKSPRYVEVGMCRNIMSVLRQIGKVTCVGVFVNASVGEILATMDTLGLNLAQLHGGESPEMLKVLDGKAFKAIRLSPESVETSVYPFLQSVPESASPAVLVDAAVKGVYGGSGVTADWNGAAELAKKYSLLLAGGLTPENVCEAVRQVKPWGVDVASGVESAPGVKDPSRMKAFVQAVKSLETGDVSLISSL
jgi:phosphoribosylanthranilate isomerase